MDRTPLAQRSDKPTIADSPPDSPPTTARRAEDAPRERRNAGRFAKILSLDDFEAAARRHLPRPIFGYVSGASEDNRTVRANRAVFRGYNFVPRVLVGVAQRSTETTLFGESFAAPFGMAPMGISALSAYRGDLVLTDAAREARIPMIMSGSSLIRMEDVVAANPDAWFQAYVPGETPRIHALIERVAKAGYRTLVVTVDTPVAANRENNVRTGFSTPLRPSLRLAWDGVTHPAWLLGTFFRTLVQHGMPHFENSHAERGAPILSSSVMRDFGDRGHLNWQHFADIRRQWPGRLVIKGVLHPDDAKIAVDHGADGIIVSNHGGRQLDGTVTPLQMLPGVVEAAPSVPVMFDSGVRRGTDILVAMALGAKFVFVGRPFNYAASVGGHDGVRHAIKILEDEVRRDMGLLGVTRLGDLSRACLREDGPAIVS